MAAKINFAAVSFLLILAAAIVEKTDAATYVVGDSLGWTIPSSASVYSNWASQHTFHVGDILVFNFPTGAHDVAIVQKPSYDGCTSSNPISLVTVGPASINLTSPGQAYFICTFSSHCSLGQKLTIDVTAGNSTTPPPPIAAPAPKSTPPPVSTPPPASTPSTTPAPPASTPSATPAPPTSAPTPATTPTAPAPAPTTPAGVPAPSPASVPSSSPAPGPGRAATPSGAPSPGAGSPGASPPGPPGESLSPPPPPSSAPATATVTILVMLLSFVIGIMW